jgi:hypothetical protein
VPQPPIPNPQSPSNWFLEVYLMNKKYTFFIKIYK